MYNDPIKRWDAKDRVLNLQKKRWLPSKGDLVVDVGCAAGLFLESLKREFPSANYLGVEMTPEIADRMSGMNGIEVVTIDKISSKSVDYLCMWHMLEHSTNPQQMLQDVICLCKPNSRLLIAVPNREALGFEKRGHQWIWCQPPWVHCVHFTSAGLAALLKRSQLTNFTLCKRETLDAFHLAFLNRPDWIPLQDGLLKPAERNLSPKQKRFYYPLYSWECWYSSCNETRVALGKRLSEIVTPRKKQTELMCLVSVS
jgi:SAM-dependent methyltransferase